MTKKSGSSSSTSWCVVLIIVNAVTNVEAQSAENTSNQTTFNNSIINGNEGRFACLNSNLTFDLDDVCDGQYRCPYLDDEYACDNENCSSGEFSCDYEDSLRCITLEYVCDGDSDCAQNDIDEILCDPIDCVPSCQCSAYSVHCEGPNIIDDRYIRKSTRSLSFSGESINATRMPLSMPLNITTYPLLLQLYISNTGLREIIRGDFVNLSELRIMHLSSNNIIRIEDFSFGDLSKLTILDLSHNIIASLSTNTFAGLTSLTEINLSYNPIAVLPEGVFRWFQLDELELKFSGTLELQPACFQGLDSITQLILYGNGITSLPSGVFTGLDNIGHIHLFDNRISNIGLDAFKGLHTLEFIDLTNNSIRELRKGMFDDLSNLTWVSFSDNPLEYIEPGTFRNLGQLEFLNLVNVQLDNLQPDTFTGITSLKGLSTDDYRLCCLFEKTDLCTIASSNFLDSCSRLMPNIILRIFLWIIGFGALIGNTIVLVLRFRTDHSANAKIQGLFITNLAVADFLMGLYMIIISSADIYYGEYFYLYAAKWRSSVTCKVAGFIAVLSSETSVFILAIITVDRLLCVVFPFGKLKFRSTSARVGVALIWLTALIVSIVPLIVSSYVVGFYGLSDVCVGLPLNVESRETGELVFNIEARVFEYIRRDTTQHPSWVYSIAIFLGVNFLIFILILISYIVIFVHVRQSARSVAKPASSSGSSSDRAREVKLASRMALIVLTDFFCWMPVIIMGILSQSGAVALPVSLYAWSVVFILPINASINPYLYTFIAVCGRSNRKAASNSTTKTRYVTTITETKA